MSDSDTYNTITIVGVGLIGGSFGLALRRRGYSGSILGVSRPEPLEHAKRLGVIDEGYPYEQVVDAAARSDLVVLATPIARLIELIRELGAAGDALRPGTVITDVGSTKREVLEAARASLPKGIRFIGGHPMAGSEERGVAAADPLLFENAIWVLTPSDDVPAEETSRLGKLISTTGARVLLLEPAEHDHVAASISHLPQIIAVELINSLDDLGENRSHAVHLAAGGFRDMTRIGSSPFDMWKDILSTNREEILGTLEAFVERLKRRIDSFDDASLEDAFARSRKTRADVRSDTKGFLSRLWELRVVVEDKPGMIADISGHLYSKGINIKDMGVVKVREGETGSVRLAFKSREDADAALVELGVAGYQARFRE